MKTWKRTLVDVLIHAHEARKLMGSILVKPEDTTEKWWELMEVIDNKFEDVEARISKAFNGDYQGKEPLPLYFVFRVTVYPKTFIGRTAAWLARLLLKSVGLKGEIYSHRKPEDQDGAD